MKLKKCNYIIVLILMLIIGIDRTYAAASGSKYCYYMTVDGNFKASAKLSYGYKNPGMHGLNDFAKVSVDKVGEGNFQFNNESILNWWSNLRVECVKNGNVCFDEKYYQNSQEANADTNPTCPHYLVFQHCNEYRVWGTESEAKAQKAVQEIKNSGCTGYYASYERGGVPLQSDAYYSEFIQEGIVKYDLNGEVTCADYNELFGDKNDPESISYMIHSILKFVRIIVPILIILLGILDFGKAVIAGKEDQMKKAQMDFVKRVVIGVAVFFVPVIVDIIMELADLVWAGEYVHCDL